mmetsp:Transcript_45312/g.112554  ORF Transcript_45312/g.112554 Transcript_45312/m.112554 type:complete len:209 (-) Transcript_45312:511-1137(-)
MQHHQQAGQQHGRHWLKYCVCRHHGSIDVFVRPGHQQIRGNRAANNPISKRPESVGGHPPGRRAVGTHQLKEGLVQVDDERRHEHHHGRIHVREGYDEGRRYSMSLQQWLGRHKVEGGGQAVDEEQHIADEHPPPRLLRVGRWGAGDHQHHRPKGAQGDAHALHRAHGLLTHNDSQYHRHDGLRRLPTRRARLVRHLETDQVAELVAE